MKMLMAFSFCCLMSTAAAAQQPAPAGLTLALVLTPTDQAQWNAMTIAMDQCIGAALLRQDLGACQALQGYLSDFRSRLGSAPVMPAKPAD